MKIDGNEVRTSHVWNESAPYKCYATRMRDGEARIIICHAWRATGIGISTRTINIPSISHLTTNFVNILITQHVYEAICRPVARSGDSAALLFREEDLFKRILWRRLSFMKRHTRCVLYLRAAMKMIQAKHGVKAIRLSQ